MGSGLLRGSLLRSSFRTGITIKGIDGVLETIGGIALWFISPEKMNAIARVLLAHEIERDPHDFVAAHLMHLAQRMASADPTFASVYLLAHGIAKVVLVSALWANKFWAYPATIVVFGTFCAYETYRWTHTHSFTLAVLTLFDLGVIALTWMEFRARRAERIRHALSPREAQPAT
jgi:uncharacterized membrane protein